MASVGSTEEEYRLTVAKNPRLALASSMLVGVGINGKLGERGVLKAGRRDLGRQGVDNFEVFDMYQGWSAIWRVVSGAQYLFIAMGATSSEGEGLGGRLQILSKFRSGDARDSAPGVATSWSRTRHDAFTMTGNRGPTP